MGQGFSLGQFAADQAAILSVKDVAGGVQRVYTDIDDNFKSTGVFVDDIKNQSFDSITFAGVLIFIVAGTTILLYGPTIFSSLDAISSRIAAHGINISL